MAKYTSRPITVARSQAELMDKFADFSRLQESIDNMPAEARDRIGDVAFTADTIEIKTPQVGTIRLKVVSRTPEQLVLQTEGSPIPLNLEVDLKPEDATHTTVTGAIDVEIPMMLRPMIGPTLQKAVDKFGELFATLA